VATAVSFSGGIAYAANGVPGWVQSSLNSFSEEQGHGEVDLVKIVDFTTPDGNRVAVWRGRSADGQVCELLGDNFNTEQTALASTLQCRDDDEESLLARRGAASRPYPLGGSLDPETVYPYVYGQLLGAARVVVTGPDFRRAKVVDPDTGGYSMLLPRDEETEPTRARFLDGDGNVIRTVELEE